MTFRGPRALSGQAEQVAPPDALSSVDRASLLRAESTGGNRSCSPLGPWCSPASPSAAPGRTAPPPRSRCQAQGAPERSLAIRQRPAGPVPKLLLARPLAAPFADFNLCAPVSAPELRGTVSFFGLNNCFVFNNCSYKEMAAGFGDVVRDAESGEGCGVRGFRRTLIAQPNSAVRVSTNGRNCRLSEPRDSEQHVQSQGDASRGPRLRRSSTSMAHAPWPTTPAMWSARFKGRETL